MSNTEKPQPTTLIRPQAPVDSPLSMRDLSALLVKHYDLHEGRYDLLIEFHIGVGNIGPNPESAAPGAMININKVGLVPAPPQSGPTTVDASIVNPAKVKRSATKGK